MEIKYKVIGEEMIIQLPERVEDEMALDFERELYCLINQGTNYKTFFNAENLEFISRSGLRALKKLRLEFGDLKMINYKPEVLKFLKDNGYNELV
jgi:anti-anti-sigma regulatory factor